MTVPTADTFEHDIVDEIRHKEASITDIASAVGDIGNTQEVTSTGSTSVFISIVTILILCGVVGAGYVGYLYYNEGPVANIAEAQRNAELQQKKLTPGISLNLISPVLDQTIGQFLTDAKKTKDGYSISIISYSPVFSYMIKNERDFADEIALAVGNTHIAKTSTSTMQEKITPPVATGTQVTATSSKPAVSTTTPKETIVELPTEYIFSDVTLGNQNMRVATSIYGTVVYAFIGTQRLVISSSVEGILSLRSSSTTK